MSVRPFPALNRVVSASLRKRCGAPFGKLLDKTLAPPLIDIAAMALGRRSGDRR